MYAISQEIKVNTDEMNNNEKSPYAIVYFDKEFLTTDKKHNVKTLLRLGWLLCKHQNKDEQALELWHLINPDMEEYVTKTQVMEFMNTLVHFSVVLMQSKSYLLS